MRKPFWLRPKWVVGHVLCLTLVVLFVNLGFWQLRRLDEKQARNDRIESRMQGEPVPLAEALRDGPEAAEFRRVEVRGRWDVEDTVLVRSVALDGRPGYHVVTPLETADGTVLVNRGFAPIGGGGEEAILRAARPEDGTVAVEGIVRPTETRGSFGPREPGTGTLRVVNRVDIDRLQQQIDAPLAPVFVQLESPGPAAGAIPKVLPLPDTNEGSHRAYAFQWFIFATVGAVGWPILLRKTARDEAREVEPV